MQARNAQLSLLLGLLAAVSVLSIAHSRAQLAGELAAICNEARQSLRGATFGAKDAVIGAAAYHVENISTGTVLAERRGTEPLPLASLTKLMTVRIALERNAPDEFYTVVPEDLLSEGSIGFVPGQTYRLSELTKALLVASSNNAAAMLARSSGLGIEGFIAAMNERAQALGLFSLHYGSVSGLDTENDTVATARGSARDTVRLLALDARDFPDAFTVSTQPHVVMTDTRGATIMLENTDKAIGSLPLLIASKTGYTDTAGGNLAVLWKSSSGAVLGAAVLGSTESGRFADMITLHDAADDYMASVRAMPSECK